MPERRRPLGVNRRGLLGGMAAGLTLSACGTRWPKGANGEEMRVNLYNWDTYTGATTLQDSKTATGIEVRMSLYANNDELVARLKGRNPGFDVPASSPAHCSPSPSASMISLSHSSRPAPTPSPFPSKSMPWCAFR